MYKLVICIILIVVAIIVLYSSPKHNSGDLNLNDLDEQYVTRCLTGRSSAVRSIPSTSNTHTRSGRPLRDPERLQRVNQEWKKMSTNSTRQARIKWRDEETSKELASIQTIPNRHGDLPDVTHLRPFYNPSTSKLRNMANNAESGISDLMLNVKSVPDISMIPNRSIMFEND